MTTYSPTPRPAPGKSVPGGAATPISVLAVTTVATAVAAVLASVVAGFAPDTGANMVDTNVPILLTGAALAAATAIVALVLGRARRPRPAVRIVAVVVGGIAGLLLLYAASGILFDVLRLLGIMPDPRGDAAPSIPIDLFGALMRLTALLACASVITLTVRLFGSGRRRLSPSSRVGVWVAVAAAVSSLPYMVLKAHWALGGTFGIANGAGLKLNFLAGWGTILMEGVGTAGCLALALVQFWRRVVPAGIPVIGGRRVARPLVLIPGWLGAGLLITTGLPGVVSMVTEFSEKTANAPTASWIFVLVYGGWFCWGLLVAAAMAIYQTQSRDETPTS